MRYGGKVIRIGGDFATSQIVEECTMVHLSPPRNSIPLQTAPSSVEDKSRGIFFRVFQRSIRYFIALLLFLAAFLKGYQLTTEPVAGFSLLTSRWFQIGLVEYQLALGLWLICGYRPTLARIVALNTFGIFCVVSLIGALSGESSCGCFGKVSFNPWLALSLDLAVVGCLICWHPATKSEACGLQSHRTAVLSSLLVALTGGALAAYRPDGERGEINDETRVVLLEPERWVGRPLPLQKYINIGNELTRGRWVVLLYRHDCRACEEEVPHYARLARAAAESLGSPKFAFVEVPPRGRADFLRVLREGPHRLGVLNETKTWFVATPGRLFLEDGIVRSANEGEVWLRSDERTQ